MACPNYESLILDYFDGTVPVEDRRSLESHLESCSPCRAFWERQKEIDAALSGAVIPPSLSADFKERLMHRVELESVERIRFWSIPEGLNMAGYLFVAAAIGFTLQYIVMFLMGVSLKSAFPENFAVYTAVVASGAFVLGGLWMGLKERVKGWTTHCL